MTKTITQKNKLLGFLLVFLSLVGSSAFNKANAQSYCTPYSYYGCLYSGYYYWPLERVNLLDVSGNYLLQKPADACNAGAISTPNASGNGYTLMSSKPSFSLSSGSKYTLQTSCSYGTTTYGYSIRHQFTFIAGLTWTEMVTLLQKSLYLPDGLQCHPVIYRV
jgi:hypothetical protein